MKLIWIFFSCLMIRSPQFYFIWHMDNNIIHPLTPPILTHLANFKRSSFKSHLFFLFIVNGIHSHYYCHIILLKLYWHLSLILYMSKPPTDNSIPIDKKLDAKDSPQINKWISFVCLWRGLWIIIIWKKNICIGEVHITGQVIYFI